MWEKGKNLAYLYVKLSVLSIGGARLIFINTTKCPTKSLFKKWDVVLSRRFVCFYSLSRESEKSGKNCDIFTLTCRYFPQFLMVPMYIDKRLVLYPKRFKTSNVYFNTGCSNAKRDVLNTY